MAPRHGESAASLSRALSATSVGVGHLEKRILGGDDPAGDLENETIEADTAAAAKILGDPLFLPQSRQNKTVGEIEYMIGLYRVSDRDKNQAFDGDEEASAARKAAGPTELPRASSGDMSEFLNGLPQRSADEAHTRGKVTANRVP